MKVLVAEKGERNQKTWDAKQEFFFGEFAVKLTANGSVQGHGKKERRLVWGFTSALLDLRLHNAREISKN